MTQRLTSRIFIKLKISTGIVHNSTTGVSPIFQLLAQAQKKTQP